MGGNVTEEIKAYIASAEENIAKAKAKLAETETKKPCPLEEGKRITVISESDIDWNYFREQFRQLTCHLDVVKRDDSSAYYCVRIQFGMVDKEWALNVARRLLKGGKSD